MKQKWLFFALVALAVVAVDQWTKFLVLDELTWAFQGQTTLAEKLSAFITAPPKAQPETYHYNARRAVTLSEDFFRLRYAENQGAAFGLFRSVPEGWRGPLFFVVMLGAVGLIGGGYHRLKGEANERWARWGLPLVLGGAVGNYLDRLTHGFVVDFLEAHWFDKATWPSFNAADTAIVVGVGLLLIDSVVRKETKR